MRILTRYVLKEFLVPYGYCLVGFLSIYVMFELFGSFSRMMEAKLPFGELVTYFCAYLAPYCHYIAPAALMLATIYTMWNFCRHSEIIAMRANGISFVTIVKPLLAMAILTAVGVAWVNESYVPRTAHWAAQMKTVKFDMNRIEHADNIVFRNAKENRTWNIDRMLDVAGTQLARVKVTLDRPGGTRLMTINAERGHYLDGEWWFENPTVQHYDALGQEVATDTPALDALPYRCFPEFSERPTDFIMQNRPWKYNAVRDRLRYLKTHPELSGETRRDYLYDTWAQILSPFACIVITLFAIPAGIASGRQSVFKGILGALGMYFAFYVLTIGCMIVAKNGWLNPIAATVLPAAVFLALGVRAFIKQR